MEKHYFFLYLSLLLGFPLLHGYSAYAKGTADGSEQWGYVEVRPSKLLFINLLAMHLLFTSSFTSLLLTFS
jgi:hypothetical protein